MYIFVMFVDLINRRKSRFLFKAYSNQKLRITERKDGFAGNEVFSIHLRIAKQQQKRLKKFGICVMPAKASRWNNL